MKAIMMTAIGGPMSWSCTISMSRKFLRQPRSKVRLKAAGVNPVDTKIRHNGLFMIVPCLRYWVVTVQERLSKQAAPSVNLNRAIKSGFVMAG